MKLDQDALLLAGVVVAALIAAAYLKKKMDAVGGLPNAAAAAVTTAIDTGVSAIGYGVGDAIGLPRTNQMECQAALNAGDMWTASFKCPAGTFLGGLWDAAATKASDAGAAIGTGISTAGSALGSVGGYVLDAAGMAANAEMGIY